MVPGQNILDKMYRTKYSLSVVDQLDVRVMVRVRAELATEELLKHPVAA